MCDGDFCIIPGNNHTLVAPEASYGDHRVVYNFTRNCNYAVNKNRPVELVDGVLEIQGRSND